MKDLSVIVVSYNTKALTKQTLDAIRASLSTTPDITAELIVVDNNSSDGSKSMLNAYSADEAHIDYRVILNDENIGFGAANNLGIKSAKGQYVLFLNSDVIADTVDFKNVLTYMDDHPKIGIVTVRVELPNGKIDPASHRGFPTVWRSLCYFSKLQAATRTMPFLKRIFGGYHLTYKKLDAIHEIDSPTAAFYLTRLDILNKVRGFDETYFMYGEDLDLSYRIKKLGYSAMYYPLFTVVHLKYQSGLKTKKKKTQSTTIFHFYNAMKIFYDKHYAPSHPAVLNALVHRAIDFKYRMAAL